MKTFNVTFNKRNGGTYVAQMFAYHRLTAISEAMKQHEDKIFVRCDEIQVPSVETVTMNGRFGVE